MMLRSVLWFCWFLAVWGFNYRLITGLQKYYLKRERERSS